MALGSGRPPPRRATPAAACRCVQLLVAHWLEAQAAPPTGRLLAPVQPERSMKSSPREGNRAEPQDILARTRLIGKGKVHAFAELHIEQGPELEDKVRKEAMLPTG